MTRYDELINLIKSGELGFNRGIDFPVSKLSNHLGGIMQRTQYLILGKSKTGKSRFGYDSFVFSPLEWLFNAIKEGADLEELPYDLRVPLFSFEIPPVKILTIAVCRFLYYKYNIYTHPKYVAGGFGPCAKEVYDALYSPEVKEFIDFIDARVTYYTVANPMQIWQFITKELDPLCNIISTDKIGNKLYDFKNTKLRYHVLLDHLSLTQQFQGADLKKTIDYTSFLLFTLKNSYPISTAILQQINPQDRKDRQELVLPDHENLRDTKNTFQDCDVCISLGAPYHLERIEFMYKGMPYHIKPDEANGGVGLKDKFRVVGVQKDRDGESNVMAPCGYLGEIGKFVDMPDPDWMDDAGNTIYDVFDIKRTHG